MPERRAASGRVLSRRHALATTAALGGVFAAGCAGRGTSSGQPASAAPKTLSPGAIEFWNHWGEGTPGALGWQAVMDTFAAAHPGLTVKRVVLASNVMNEKIVAAAVAGTPPALMDMSAVQYAAAVPRGLLVKLDPYARTYPTTARSAFLPAALETIVLNDGVYATPTEFGTLLLYYNADLLHEAGAKPPVASWRWDREFLDVARQATRVDVSPEAQRFGVEHITNGWWGGQWWASVWSAGGDLLTKDHKKSALADAPAVGELQFLVDLKHKWRVTPSDEGRQAGGQGRPFFESGRVAFLPNGAFYYAQVKDNAKFQWGVAQLPQGKAGSIPSTGGWLIGASSGSAQQDAAVAFLGHYLQPSVYAEFLRFVSWTPPIKATERPPIVADAKHWDAFVASGKAARSLPSLPLMDDILKLASDALKPVFDAGTQSAQAATRDLGPRIDALLSANR